MNYLAHIFLSGKNEKVTIGNFIGDCVKGKRYLEYPEKISDGILFHRSIDLYTDTHPVVKRSIKRLRSSQGKFSGIAIDMFYDHFLAKYWDEFSSEPLDEFIRNFYQLIDNNIQHLPNAAQRIFAHMKSHNWLMNYRSLDGINRSLFGISKRTSFPSNLEKATLELEEDFEAYKADFFEFFPQLIVFCNNQLV